MHFRRDQLQLVGDNDCASVVFNSRKKLMCKFNFLNHYEIRFFFFAWRCLPKLGLFSGRNDNGTNETSLERTILTSLAVGYWKVK